MESASLGEPVEVLIALPHRYDQNDEGVFYPVVYLVDGRFNVRHTHASVELLAWVGQMPESIVVGVETSSRGRDFRPDLRGNQLLDFLEQELAPYIEQTFHTAPHRTLVGHSLGGMFVLHALASRPDMFNGYVAVSPSLRIRSEQDQTPVIDSLRIRLTSLQGEPRFLFLAAGENDRDDIRADLGRLVDLLNGEAPAELTWSHQILTGEDHATCVLKGMYEGLRAMYEGWSDNEIISTGDLESLRAHYSALSNRFGYPVPVTEEALHLLGFRLLGEDRIEAAVEVFRFAVEVHSSSPTAHDNLAYALEASGAVSEALDTCRIALGLAEEGDEALVEPIQSHISNLEQLLAAR
jgi:predicted alpha/beta superfamily hydrolase